MRGPTPALVFCPLQVESPPLSLVEFCHDVISLACRCCKFYANLWGPPISPQNDCSFRSKFLTFVLSSASPHIISSMLPGLTCSVPYAKLLGLRFTSPHSKCNFVVRFNAQNRRASSSEFMYLAHHTASLPFFVSFGCRRCPTLSIKSTQSRPTHLNSSSSSLSFAFAHVARRSGPQSSNTGFTTVLRG